MENSKDNVQIDANQSHQDNIKMVQSVLLVWLDNTIDKNSTDYKHTIIQLQQTINRVNVFTDSEECIRFLENIHDDKVCMIISDSIAQHIVPHVHQLSKVDTIFILQKHSKHKKQWKQWPKVQGVFKTIDSIRDILIKTVQRCEQNAAPVSIVSVTDDLSKRKLNQTDPSFMYTMILKEILLTINFEGKHISEYTDYCRIIFAENKKQLHYVKKMKRHYLDHSPVWWYTCPCFLSSMLNRALRVMDIDITMKLGFFIHDLHLHIARLHQEQYEDDHRQDSFQVYLGQGMSKVEFTKLQQNKGGLLAFNNFLLTSKNREVSTGIACDEASNPDNVGILFIMNIDPTQTKIPFASIAEVSYHENEEDRILFPMHSVFRINSIKSMNKNPDLFRIKLTLTSDNDEDLQTLTNRIREESFPDQLEWARLGSVLCRMGQFQKAEHIYKTLLEQQTEESAKTALYYQLGVVNYEQGKYQKAIEFYDKSFEIMQETLSLDDPKFVDFYNNIGNVYNKMGDYTKALAFYKKVLEITEKSLPSNHPDLAGYYHNIGGVYDEMGNRSKALWYLEKALEIQKKSLPRTHPDIAMSYSSIGTLYSNIRDHSKALWYFEKALEMQQQSLPAIHPDLAISYSNIGMAHDEMHNYPKALWYFEKALVIEQLTFPPNHINFAGTYNNIGTVYANMGDYSKALQYFEKALEIQQQSLPGNHPDLAGSYHNIGGIFESMGNDLKAYQLYDKAIKIGEQSLPQNHPDLKMYRNDLVMMRRNY